jgi:hypothetical protein
MKLNLVNGLPPRYRGESEQKRWVTAKKEPPRKAAQGVDVAKRYGLVAFRNASLTSPAALCAAPLALSNLPSA